MLMHIKARGKDQPWFTGIVTRTAHDNEGNTIRFMIFKEQAPGTKRYPPNKWARWVKETGDDVVLARKIPVRRPAKAPEQEVPAVPE